MFALWLSALIFLSTSILVGSNLRCTEDLHGSLQLIENCRACVIFIAPANLPTTRSTTSTTRLPKNMIMSYDEPSIEELFLFDEHKRRRRRRRRQDNNNNETIIHQQCARESDGPLFGYDQTHCYCNSNQCNSNIQRCIYEVTSKRHFACYHGSNSSQYPMEIRHKCRSCRIRTDFQSMHYYECLTFGEREQNDRSQCVCQRPMCNENVSTCQRLQPASSQPRNNVVVDHVLNLTMFTATTKTTTTMQTTTTTIRTMTTTTPTMARVTTTTTVPLTTTTPITSTTIMTSTSTSTVTYTSAPSSIDTSTMSEVSLNSTTPPDTTDMTIIETEEDLSTENSTVFDLTTVNDTWTSPPELQPLKTVMIVVSNRGNEFSSQFNFRFTLFQALFVLVIYSM